MIANSWVKQRMKDGQRYDPQDCAFLAVGIVREGRFSREAIAARRQVFDVLNQYTTMLNAVIMSNAPARWDSAAKGLGAASGALLTTVNDVGKAGDDSKAVDDSKLGPLRELIGDDGPVTRLISFAGRGWINYNRAKALDAVISEAKPQIDRISMLLREDFNFVREREAFEVKEALSSVLFAYAEATGTAVADPSKDPARKLALAQVETVLIANETKLVEIQSIGSAMDAFDDAHAALVAYAESAKKPEDISALVTVVKRYAAAAKDVYEAYKVSLEKRAN